MALTPLALAACGDQLGEYQVEDIRRVAAIPACEECDLPRLNPRRNNDFLAVDLSSDFDLQLAETGAGLYANADFFPLANRSTILAFGPLAADHRPVENWRRADPLPRDRDNLFHYIVYLASGIPERRGASADDPPPAYDLRTSERDVCLRFFVPGYSLTPSRPGTVRLSAIRLQAAVRGPVVSQP